MNTKAMQNNLTAKIAIALAALAAMFVVAVAPSQAFAIAGNQSEPDDIIAVNWTATDGNGDQVSCTANVDLSLLNASTGTLGALYEKTTSGVNQVSVIKTDEYVSIPNILNAAHYTYTYEDNESGEEVTETYTASDYWASGKSLTFDVWNLNKAKTAWDGVALYTKNSTFTFANMTANLAFYNASSTAIDTTDSTSNPHAAVIALKSKTVAIPSNSTASAILSDNDNYDTVGYTTGTLTYDTPRLVWGYNTSGSQAGNRFPSNIDGINIVTD